MARPAAVPASTREYHVEPSPDGHWWIRRENAGGAGKNGGFAFYPDRNAAESAARVLAHQNEGTVHVHEGDGTVRRTDHRGRPLP
jgi:hypothetical protein